MTGRHLRQRRVPTAWAAPLVAVAVGIAAIAGVVATGARLAPVVGTAVPGPREAPIQVAEEPPTSAVPAPPSSTPKPPPSPRPTTAPPPRTVAEPAPSQPRGTVRLSEGGTATLVRRDVVDGVLPVPDDLGEATWWGAGPEDASGATVLAGHVNWNGAIGPFAELWRSERGDPVTVVDARGATVRYAMTEILTLDKDELPARAADLFAQSGPHRLVLVTCGGRWVGGADGYAENRIVIARRVS